MLYDFFCPVQLHMFRSAITSYRVPSVPARPSNQPMQIQYKALQEHVRQQILYINVKGTHTACSDAAMQHAVMTKTKTLVFHTCFASLSSIHVSHPCLQCLSSEENSSKFLEMSGNIYINLADLLKPNLVLLIISYFLFNILFKFRPWFSFQKFQYKSHDNANSISGAEHRILSWPAQSAGELRIIFFTFLKSLLLKRFCSGKLLHWGKATLFLPQIHCYASWWKSIQRLNHLLSL